MKYLREKAIYIIGNSSNTQNLSQGLKHPSFQTINLWNHRFYTTISFGGLFLDILDSCFKNFKWAILEEIYALGGLDHWSPFQLKLIRLATDRRYQLAITTRLKPRMLHKHYMFGIRNHSVRTTYGYDEKIKSSFWSVDTNRNSDFQLKFKLLVSFFTNLNYHVFPFYIIL